MIWLIVESLMVMSAAWLGWRWLGGDGGLIEQWLGWLLAAITLIAGAGVLLSATGRLGGQGFLILYPLLLSTLVVLRRGQLQADWRAVRRLLANTRMLAKSDRMTFAAVLALGLFLVVTGMLAIFAEATVYDALTYRLSRIGHWLQEGRIAFVEGSDPRQNYMPVVPDLLMTWLIAGNDTGWRPAALVQWMGGVLLLLATTALARRHGLGRAPSLGAALLCAGLANVTPQFTTMHTDLLTAGLVASAYVLWRAGNERGQGSWLAGIGGGLAIGAKGTVFYFVPTLAIWLFWRWRRERSTLAIWLKPVTGAAMALLVFAVPGYVQNWREYGGVFGPPEFVAMHHQGGGLRLPAKTLLNLSTSVVQNLEPHAQPPGVQVLTSMVGRWLADRLPSSDDFAYEQLNRRKTLRMLLAGKVPDADVAGMGVILPGLGLLGFVLALSRRYPGGDDIVVLGVGLLVFAVFFHAMQQWHPYAFRYFTLASPWLAVMAVWGMQQLPAAPKSVAWTFGLGSALLVAVHMLVYTHQAGWPAVIRPEASRPAYVAAEWRRWVLMLDQAGAPLRPSLPFNRPLAALYRNGSGRKVHPLGADAATGTTAEKILADHGSGWLVVPAARFLGQEGAVAGRVWLDQGDPESPFSVAAYRRLVSGEFERPMVYRQVVRWEDGRLYHDLLVRPGANGEVSLLLASPTGFRHTIVTPLEVVRGEHQGGELTVKIQLPGRQVAEVRLWLEPAGSDHTPSGLPPAGVMVRVLAAE